MKRSICLLLAVLTLFVSLSGLTAHAATGSLTATASSNSITIGNFVTITLKYDGGGAKIGSIDAQLSYNAKAFEFVSCDGFTANGGAGIVRMSYFATGTAADSVSATLKFKAIAAGAGDFAVTTSEFSNDDDYSSLGTPSKTLSVSAMNPTLSANADLASIKPSSGTLTPKFSANVTNYTISVPYTTTSLSLSATAQEKGAKIAVTGKNALTVGANTQVITVTAPNGTTKKYTVVINRSPNQTTTTTTTTRSPSGSTTEPTSTTTTTAPQEDPLEVAVDGVLMTIIDTQADVTLPENFAWSHITINNITVSAAVNETTDMTLVYLKNALDSSTAFYIYDDTTEMFSLFCPLKVNGGSYVLLDMPAGIIPPHGAVAGVHSFDSIERKVFTFEDAALKDVLLVYATSPAGKTGLYMHDIVDGSMQLYREITVAADNEPEPTEPQPSGAFAQFVTQNRQVILICAAAAGGVALLIGAVILLILTTRKDKECKH